jgi:diaminohydroxyphosphoribosylaminopyrimidine deaminase / 5-amino-6-(5-phosphoribosylamino)uracil reductase
LYRLAFFEFRVSTIAFLNDRCSSVLSVKKKTQADRKWMARALDLARRGTALASPNPMVGAVVVRGGRKVGEGFHAYDRRDHAEIVALRRAGRRARGATLYVTLEPCCRTGRTGPCTEAVIAAGVKRVVASMRDPNPAVNGRGLARLRRAGLRVDIGEGAREARKLNEPFARWARTRLPLVTLKAALSLDGLIAPARNKRLRHRPAWITSPESRRHVHQLRHAADAILTGIGTVLADDPLLTDRTGLPRRRPLLRVVLDSLLRLPLGSRLVRTARGDVMVFTTAEVNSKKARALARACVEIVRVRARGGRVDLRAALRELGRRGILSVLVEGGSRLNTAALSARVVDKLVLFVAPKALGRGVSLVAGGRQALEKLLPLREVERRHFGLDLHVAGYLRDVYRNS